MDWQTLRNQFIRDTGDFPGGPLEDELIKAYEQNPAAVERAVEKITAGHKLGKIRSPWGALKAEALKSLDATRNPTHDRGATRQKAVERAEQWLRTAGLHFDRHTEIEDELFGERGLAKTDNPETRERLLELYDELAPLGAKVEQDAIDRGLKHQAQRQKLGNRPPNRDPETITP